MARAILIKSGGGGTSSDDVTATKNDILYGKTALTNDSNDEPIMGTIETINGGTFTPTKSVQTIACKGKKVLSNVVITSIPSSYINVSSGSYLMSGASLGALVNRGVTGTCPRRTGGTNLGSQTCGTLWGNCSINGWQSYELAEYNSSAGGYYFGGYYSGDTLCFKGSIDLTPFNTCTVSVHMTTNSSLDFGFAIFNTAKTVSVRYLAGHLRYVSGEGNTVRDATWTIPLNGVNGHHYIAMYGYHGNGIGGATVRSVRLT